MEQGEDLEQLHDKGERKALNLLYIPFFNTCESLYSMFYVNLYIFIIYSIIHRKSLYPIFQYLFLVSHYPATIGWFSNKVADNLEGSEQASPASSQARFITSSAAILPDRYAP